MNDIETEKTQVETHRIHRLIEVLALIATGELSPEVLKIETGTGNDAFTELEQTLAQFTQDLGEVLAANERFVNELQDSAKEMEEKLRTIERQQIAIRELSTPIIEIWDNVLTLPVVGVVDTQRSVEMTQKLLHRIAETKARCVIIDITGVDVVDTMTADHLMQMVKAASFLGAFCVMTGISPELAQTLARIGVDLPRVKTLRSLKDGLEACFERLRIDPSERLAEALADRVAGKIRRS